MAATHTGDMQTLYLPLDIIQASAGFAFDFGSSILKVIYRSKADFSDGQPIGREAVKDGKGRVHLVMFPREGGVDALVSLVTEQCDVTRPSGGEKPVVQVTGIGANFFKQEIESKLQVTLQIVMEDVNIRVGFKALFDYLPPDELYYPIQEEGLQGAKVVKDFLRGWYAASGKVVQEEHGKLTVHQLPSGDKPYLPSLIVNCGSALVLMLMNENEDLIMIDGIPLGKTLLSFATYCLGKKDFGELMREIESADATSCDIYFRELTAESGSGNYDAVTDIVLFAMGKLEHANPDDVKKADLALSMLMKDVIVLAQMSYVYALVSGVRKIYFTGSFINIRLVRQILAMEIQGRSEIKPEDQKMEHHFMHHGSFCGALGAFIQGKN